MSKVTFNHNTLLVTFFSQTTSHYYCNIGIKVYLHHQFSLWISDILDYNLYKNVFWRLYLTIYILALFICICVCVYLSKYFLRITIVFQANCDQQIHQIYSGLVRIVLNSWKLIFPSRSKSASFIILSISDAFSFWPSWFIICESSWGVINPLLS